MAIRTQFENSSEVGVFSKLTSSYCLTPLGNPQFYSAFEAELADHIPVIQATFAGTKIVGRMCVGNSKGLLVPHTTTD
jgi:translation initiation factor 6